MVRAQWNLLVEGGLGGKNIRWVGMFFKLGLLYKGEGFRDLVSRFF